MIYFKNKTPLLYNQKNSGVFCTKKMKQKQKYYVVWQGHNTGIYTSWDECKQQVNGFENAKYKSFENLAEAQTAFENTYKNYIKYYPPTLNPNPQNLSPETPPQNHLLLPAHQQPIYNSIAVDAACQGNPGLLEYKGVLTQQPQTVIFKQGPFEAGTNNIGEFLAIVHALGYLKKQNSNLPIYSDSKTAMSWVKNKKIKTNLIQTPKNEYLFELIQRAINWLQNNTYQNPILKWETTLWGENPADFGRK